MRRHGAKATRRSGCDDVPVVDDRSGSGSVLAPGSLLVAAPGLLDPNFHRTVVYLIEHRDGGSLGVVLNRPSEVSVRDVLPTWAPLCPSVAVFAWPVSRERAGLPRAHRARPGRSGWSGVGTVAATGLGSGRAVRPAAGMRVCRYSAGPGQLDGEVARGKDRGPPCRGG